eukprot:CAMPEP_0171120968 /NCGR_PEP_ID=MMETSP0766_2-20121228/101119_1 /TAXON_ID=439317 /ORGANISM="Gambierdiscus australes, Strain CAWD 149" /LENGTH=42 /DNA_ID= /DNA_START= /DNA_END= /DNA_ORIENTATION=
MAWRIISSSARRTATAPPSKAPSMLPKALWLCESRQCSSLTA